MLCPENTCYDGYLFNKFVTIAMLLMTSLVKRLTCSYSVRILSLPGLTNSNGSNLFWQVKGVEHEFDGDE